MKISELVGVMPPEVFTLRRQEKDPLIGADPTLLYGVELEIEGLRDDRSEHLVSGMYVDDDNSLRNHGGEFITKPMTQLTLREVLNNFFQKNKFTADNYSDRTSIHVHVNVGDLEEGQLQTVLLLYQTYEKLLFQWAGDGRDENIFCVPWSETLIAENLFRNDFFQSARRWQKYTALNLLPIFTQGTIEFRHLAGTCDLGKIIMWLELIGKMFAFARRVPLDEFMPMLMELNTSSRYAELSTSVFEEHASELMRLPTYMEYIEEGVLNAKLLVGTLDKPKKTAPPPVRPDRMTSAEFAAEIESMQRRTRDRQINRMRETQMFNAAQVFATTTTGETPIVMNVTTTRAT